MAKPYTRSRWWTVPVLVLFVGCAIAAFATLRELILACKSSSWPAVQGEILEIFPMADYGNVYAPAVRYRYEVGQESFENYLIAFGDPIREIRRKLSKEAIKTLRSKKAIEVYFSPQDPRTSVLVPGVYWEVPLSCAMFNASLVFLGWLLVHMWRSNPTNSMD